MFYAHRIVYSFHPLTLLNHSRGPAAHTHNALWLSARTYSLKRMFIPLFFDSHRHPQFAIRFCVFRLFLIAFQRIAVVCVSVCVPESRWVRERFMVDVRENSKRWLFTCYPMLNCKPHSRAYTLTHTHRIANTIVFSFSVFSFLFDATKYPIFSIFFGYFFSAPFLHLNW